MAVGILVLVSIIGILVYLSQKKSAESQSAQATEREVTKESLGVFSRDKSAPPAVKESKAADSEKSEETGSGEVLKGQTVDSDVSSGEKTVAAQTTGKTTAVKMQPEKSAKAAAVHKSIGNTKKNSSRLHRTAASVRRMTRRLIGPTAAAIVKPRTRPRRNSPVSIDPSLYT